MDKQKLDNNESVPIGSFRSIAEPMTMSNKIVETAKSYRLKRQSLPEALAESLRERILNGEFQPGEALVQETLAEEYECSRMPVREAFRQLEAAGLIVTKVHKGAVVAALSPEQVLELFELRALLESDMLAHAIPNMTNVSLKASAKTLQDLNSAYQARDVSRWGSLNWEFHRSLYEPGDRAQSMIIAQGINLQVERFIRLQLLISETFETANSEHAELLRLCNDGDVKHAVAFLREHIMNAGESLVFSLIERRTTT